MHTHLTVVGAAYTAFGALFAVLAAISAFAIAGGGIISGDPEAMEITSTVSVFVGVLLLIPAVPFLIGGIGLLRYEPWSRVLVLVLAVLSLFAIPFGTILGAYSIWVLTRPQVAELFLDDVA